MIAFLAFLTLLDSVYERSKGVLKRLKRLSTLIIEFKAMNVVSEGKHHSGMRWPLFGGMTFAEEDGDWQIKSGF